MFVCFCLFFVLQKQLGALCHSFSFARTLRDDRELHIHPNSVLYGEKPPKWSVFIHLAAEVSVMILRLCRELKSLNVSKSILYLDVYERNML